MACSWSSSSDRFVTSSIYNTIKLCERISAFFFLFLLVFAQLVVSPYVAGDASTQRNVMMWSFDKGIPSQQVGNVWVNAHEIVSLSTGGDLGVVDVRESNGKTTRVIQVCHLHVERSPSLTSDSLLNLEATIDRLHLHLHPYPWSQA